MRTLGTLHALNLGSFPRRGVGIVRVPIPEELEISPGDLFRVSVGAAGSGRLVANAIRRASGRARTGTLTFDVGAMQPGRSTYSLGLHEWIDPHDPAAGDLAAFRFEVHPWLASTGARFPLSISIDGREVPLRLDSAQTAPFLASTRFVGRDAFAGFWIELHLLTPTRSPFQRFELWAGFNDDRQADALTVELESGLVLETRGAVPVFDYAENRGISVQRQQDGRYRADLGGRGLWGDSQAVLLTGRFVWEPPAGTDLMRDEAVEFAQGELQNLPLEFVAGGWRDARAFGPFGNVVSPPHMVTQEQREQAFASLAARELQRLPRSAGLFLHADHAASERPGVSGDQRDFGLGQLYEVADAERPDLLYPISLAVQQEAVRPGHYREESVEPVRASDHPLWFTYKHVTHYHPSYAADRLGKRPGRYDYARSQRGSVWNGHDPQHESINFLAARAVFRPDPWNLQLVNDWIETALAGYPLRSGTFLDGLGGTRAVGRMTLAMVWAHLATGRSDILDRALGRLHVNYAERAFSAGSLIEPTGAAQKAIRAARESARPVLETSSDARPMELEGVDLVTPTHDEKSTTTVPVELELSSPLFVSQLFGPDPRSVPVPNWSPWQESFVAQGFAALWALTGDPLAADAAWKVAKTVALYGVDSLADGSFRIGGYLAYEEGAPLPMAAWEDPARVKTYGAGVGRWLLPAFDIAASFAARNNDPDLEWLELRRRLFRTWLHRDRSRYQTTPGGWDRLTPWEQIGEVLRR